MVKNNDYLEIKEALKYEKVPRDRNLIPMKLKEIFHIESEAINLEKVGSKTNYLIRYENLLISVSVDEIERKFILSSHFDIINNEDEIIESY